MGNIKNPPVVDRTNRAIANRLKYIGEAIEGKTTPRVSALPGGNIAAGNIIEVVGIPEYITDMTTYSAYGLTEPGWYAFVRLTALTGVEVTENTTVTGAAGYIATPGEDHVDVAVSFDVAAMSQVVVIDWGTDSDTYVIKATDLAVRNLDYRTTYYMYDAEPYATWEYALTTDTTFVEGSYYYTKDENDNYTLAEVTVGEAVPADTYYKHSKVTFDGLARNVSYKLDTPIDCPIEYILPDIEDDTHGVWFELRAQYTGSFSSTLTVPEGVKVATEHTQAETKGVNMVHLDYTATGDLKIWRFLNTHASIPAETTSAETT